MASSMITAALMVSLSLLLPYSRAELVCENLPQGLCAFSISSAGKRCLLESFQKQGGGSIEYHCKTSEVVVERVSDWIETNECIEACGVDRRAVGISSDGLLDARFTAKLCSPACYQSCPNVVDLYFNLAAGEGVFLPDLCESRRANPQRSMAELLRSSGTVIPADGGAAPSLAPSP